MSGPHGRTPALGRAVAARVHRRGERADPAAGPRAGGCAGVMGDDSGDRGPHPWLVGSRHERAAALAVRFRGWPRPRRSTRTSRGSGMVGWDAGGAARRRFRPCGNPTAAPQHVPQALSAGSVGRSRDRGWLPDRAIGPSLRGSLQVTRWRRMRRPPGRRHRRSLEVRRCRCGSLPTLPPYRARGSCGATIRPPSSAARAAGNGRPCSFVSGEVPTWWKPC